MVPSWQRVNLLPANPRIADYCMHTCATAVTFRVVAAVPRAAVVMRGFTCPGTPAKRSDRG